VLPADFAPSELGLVHWVSVRPKSHGMSEVTSLGMAIYALGDLRPEIDPTAFVHPEAVVIGNVVIGAESSIWPGAVLRGDHGRITVGNQTSIQDGSVIHCTSTFDTAIGNRCVIGHTAHLEGCTIHDDSLIGSHAVILHGASVGPVSLVGALALVGNNKTVPPHARALGIPATVTPDVISISDISPSAEIYIRNSHWYRSDLKRLD
jgi:carbonic anhydrase/acetyltransferase-like protein (isoleucine patch superfamily)